MGRLAETIDRLRRRLIRRLIAARIRGAYRAPRTSVGRVELYGAPAFLERTAEALALLRDHAPELFAIAQQHIGAILSVWPSGVFTDPLTQGRRTLILMGPRLSRLRVAEYAGMIAHELEHCRLALDAEARPHPSAKAEARTHSTAEQELLCLERQCELLRVLGVAEDRIAAYRRQRDTRWWERPMEARWW